MEMKLGGHNSFQDPFAMAHAITDKQLAIAKELQTLHFNGQNSPELLAAIIQAVATNYATFVGKK